MQSVVTLVEYSVPKTGQGQYGPWSLHVFKDAGGNQYQTFKDEIANVARSLMNTPVSITYDVEVRTYQKQDGTTGSANNNVLSSVEAAAGATQSLGQPQPQQPATGGFVQPSTTVVPQQAAAAPQPVLAQPTPQGPSRETQINRSAGLARAIEAHAAGIAVVSDPTQLGLVADLFVKYIETGSFA